MAERLVPCPSCRGVFPDIDGPAHRYMESSAGCWAAHGAVMARHYENADAFASIHRLTVDAYAVQHPGRPSAQSIASVGLHLARLCLVLERGLPETKANDAMLAVGAIKRTFVWLDPPASLGAITVANAFAASDIVEHIAVSRAWAQSAWEAWSSHHTTIRKWQASPALRLPA